MNSILKVKCPERRKLVLAASLQSFFVTLRTNESCAISPALADFLHNLPKALIDEFQMKWFIEFYQESTYPDTEGHIAAFRDLVEAQVQIQILTEAAKEEGGFVSSSNSDPLQSACTVHVDLSNAEFEALRIMAESDGLTVEEAVQEAVRGELQAFFETENASEWTEEQAVLAGEARKRHTSPSALRGSLP